MACTVNIPNFTTSFVVVVVVVFRQTHSFHGAYVCVDSVRNEWLKP